MEKERERLQWAIPQLKNIQTDYFKIIDDLVGILKEIQEVGDTGTGGYIEDLVSEVLNMEIKETNGKHE